MTVENRIEYVTGEKTLQECWDELDKMDMSDVYFWLDEKPNPSCPAPLCAKIGLLPWQFYERSHIRRFARKWGCMVYPSGSFNAICSVLSGFAFYVFCRLNDPAFLSDDLETRYRLLGVSCFLLLFYHTTLYRLLKTLIVLTLSLIHI